MHIPSRTRVALSKARRPLLESRASPRFETLLFAMRSNGRYEKQYATVGIAGCYFKTTDAPALGQTLRVKLVLLGMMRQVEVLCRVIRLTPLGRSMGVAAKFENLSFKSERTIARWLDMLSNAYGCVWTRNENLQKVAGQKTEAA